MTAGEIASRQRPDLTNPFELDGNLFNTYLLDLSVARNTPTKIPISGSFLWVQDASSTNAVATIAFSDRSKGAGVNFRQGSLVRGLRFRELWVTNTAQAGAWMLLVWLGKYIDTFAVGNNVSSYTEITATKAQNLVTHADLAIVAGAAAVQVLPLNAVRREALIGSLNANTAIMRVGDANTGAARGQELPTGQTLTLATAAPIYVYNPGPGDQTISLIEVTD